MKDAFTMVDYINDHSAGLGKIFAYLTEVGTRERLVGAASYFAHINIYGPFLSQQELLSFKVPRTLPPLQDGMSNLFVGYGDSIESAVRDAQHQMKLTRTKLVVDSIVEEKRTLHGGVSCGTLYVVGIELEFIVRDGDGSF